ncbi:MAG: Na+/H+ antiporter subunit E [Ectothiorhodospiraceae bacterium]|nr:Na+/H+ antiporter subunit E [Ectothiorhodospiraceae bacterium]MCH8504735.1 Na+/H+ antiporter subunit E [Ectothiorhodospiraceae bacterium]
MQRLGWFLTTIAGLFLVWAALAEGQSLLHGLLVSVLAAAFSAWFVQARLARLRPLAVLRFFAVFLQRSVMGGVDVAWRALRPSMPLHPHWLDYPLRLKDASARAVFLGTISLMPGTLGADIVGDQARIHAILDSVDEDLRRIESLVADMFGETLEGAA